MINLIKTVGMAVLLIVVVCYHAAVAQADDALVPVRILGNPNAPVTVDEYVSLTCSHCAEFYNTVLPDLEKAYVEPGKVKFILHDFPLDGVALKAAVIARCMPAEEYYPFIKLLYKNQAAWAFSGGDPEKTIVQYAKLGGLSDDKAKACLQNTKLQDAIVAERTDASTKYSVEATPTFIVNGGAEIIKGSQTAQSFGVVFDRLLAAKK